VSLMAVGRQEGIEARSPLLAIKRKCSQRGPRPLLPFRETKQKGSKHRVKGAYESETETRTRRDGNEKMAVGDVLQRRLVAKGKSRRRMHETDFCPITQVLFTHSPSFPSRQRYTMQINQVQLLSATKSPSSLNPSFDPPSHTSKDLALPSVRQTIVRHLEPSDLKSRQSVLVDRVGQEGRGRGER
jgi:hypothetical protein